jgi:proteasome assembly chaperone (PAC2) family protein
VLDIIDGVMRKTVWPDVTLRYAVVGGRDLLVLSGSEPDLGWRKFAAAVLEIAQRFKVTELITLGSVPAAVPHTLPAPIMTTASDIERLKGEERPPEGLLRVPAAAVSMIDQHLAAGGIPTVGFFVQVPHYVSGTYPSAVIALLERVGRHLEIEIDLGSLLEDESNHRKQMDNVISDQPEAQEHVRALEAMNAEQRVVSGEELATEIERYLRDAAPKERGQGDRGQGERGEREERGTGEGSEGQTS